jgi:DNA-binding MarR family transcriptional regulator
LAQEEVATTKKPGDEPDALAAAGGESSNGGRLDFQLDANINFLLRRAHARADYLFNRVMAETGLTPRQAAIVNAAESAPGCSLSDLSRLTGVDRGTIAEMVPRLVRRGLLIQTRASDDGRAKALTCTDAGAAALREMRERTPALRAEVLRPLPVEYHELLIKMLRLLLGIEHEARTTTLPGTRDAESQPRTKD